MEPRDVQDLLYNYDHDGYHDENSTIEERAIIELNKVLKLYYGELSVLSELMNSDISTGYSIEYYGDLNSRIDRATNKKEAILSFINEILEEAKKDYYVELAFKGTRNGTSNYVFQYLNVLSKDETYDWFSLFNGKNGTADIILDKLVEGSCLAWVEKCALDNLPAADQMKFNNTNELIQEIIIPENLKGILTIWHDKSDIQNLINIWKDNAAHILTHPNKKILISYLAHELNEKGWLIDFTKKKITKTHFAKLFLSAIGLSPQTNDPDAFNLLEEAPIFNVKYTGFLKIPTRIK